MSSFACSSCGAVVPPRRLACPACGELLASVAGRPAAPRQRVAVAESEPFLEPDEPEPGPAHERATEPEPEARTAPATEPPAAEREPQLDEPYAAPFLEPDEPNHEPFLEPDEPNHEPFLEPDEPPAPAGLPITPTGAFRSGAAFAAAASAPDSASAGSLAAAPAATEPPARPGPGASTAPRWTHAQAAAAARWADVIADPGPAPAPAPAAPAATSTRPAIPALPLLVLERGVAIAAGVIAVAFLLPWGNLMIGAAVVGDPWQGLGIVGSWHWLAWLLSLPLILLAWSARAVPAWLRLGVLPIAYAGLVVGLAWPYVLGPIGGAPAPIVLVFAAVALVVLGALAVRPGGIEEGPRSA